MSHSVRFRTVAHLSCHSAHSASSVASSGEAGRGGKAETEKAGRAAACASLCLRLDTAGQPFRPICHSLLIRGTLHTYVGTQEEEERANL